MFLLFQIGLASIFLLFSTIASWYEGSAIVENTWEWKYSTPFSQLLYGQVQNSSDISQLDYFIYAVKFQPTFPVIMVISCLYLMILIGFHFFKKQYKWFTCYLSFLGGGLFFLSYFIFTSPTIGGKVLFLALLLSGLFCILLAALTYFHILNRHTKEITN
ncbi:YjdJ family protein [Neobacillus sp. PS2-9]|uniref:YjdJ family protein n=1 Tax=Neobacillus sp. PS2-9 TaxID=3070676 RepID=UPI0027DF8082|nr:YjdJ family protein [Neobacillus sp. PS2-9]WML58711.1 YjdJ family protein [Neobacillus sp. PS2-9]